VNKSMKLIAVVVVLAASYPAASWYTGKQVEAKLTESNDQSKFSPYVKVIKQDYQRGVFSSVQETTLELTLANLPGLKKPDFPGPDAADQSDDDVAEEPVDASGSAAETVPAPTEKAAKPVQLRFINRIQHGPLPGFSGFGAASIKTELVLDEETKAQLAKVFGTANPLEISAKLNYGGGGRVNISSPAFNTVLEKDKEKVVWQGLTMEVGFVKDYKDINVNFNAPGLSVDGSDGLSFKLGAISLKGDVSRAYPANSLYLGKTEASIASINVTDPEGPQKSFTLEQFKLSTDASMKDELVDLAAKIGVSKFVLDQKAFSDFHYDYGVKRLHGPSLAKISTAYTNAMSDPEKLGTLKVVWDEVAPLILQKDPELVLERLSVMTADGEAKLVGSAKLAGATATDIANPIMIISKIQSNLDITLTETLVAQMAGTSQKDPEMQKAALASLNQQISAFEGQGFITRNGKMLNSKIEWKQGSLSVNGKPFSR